ncbi:MAG: TetR/AcrR family transcriptional regulator [Sedimentisphaerales bacterium]|nr:TetR/AcrR family transcriptional regulator [Sedimentisphaerales bacterium]
MATFSERQRQVKQQAAQEAIFDAALKVISGASLEGLKMQDIAAAAGVATGTLYNYFKNKEELLYYVDQRLHDQILSKAIEIAHAPVAAGQRLSLLLQEIFSFAATYHLVFDLAERSGIVDRIPVQEKQELLDQAVATFQFILEDGVAEGAFRKVDTRKTAAVFFDAVIGILEIQKYVGTYDFTQAGLDLLGLFREYLQPDPFMPERNE